MTKEEPPRKTESQKRNSRKRAKEAAGGAAVLGAAAAMTASQLTRDQPGEQAVADPASFDAAAASPSQGSAAAATAGVAPSDVGASAPSPGGARAREGSAATPGTARDSGGSSAGTGPAQDPGPEDLQSMGSEAQGDSGGEEEYGHTGTENPLDMLFPGEPTEDAHQDLVEALPEGTGDALLRGAIWGVGPGAVITAADATGVLDDTQDRVNEQIEDFLYDEDTADVGYKILEAQAAVAEAPWEGAVAVGELAEDAGKGVEEVFHEGGDLLKELDPKVALPGEAAVGDAYWDAQFAADAEGRRTIDKLDEGAISDELGRAADSVGDIVDQAGDAAHDAGDAIGDAAEEAGDAAQDTGEDIVEGGEDVAEDIGDAVNPFD